MLRGAKDPGGLMGALTFGATILLCLGGLLSLVIMARNDQGFGAGVWTLWAVVGVANWLGCVGFLLGRRQPVLGGALAVIGALAFAAFYFWALLPLVLGPAIVLLAILRARRLGSSALQAAA